MVQIYGNQTEIIKKGGYNMRFVKPFVFMLMAVAVFGLSMGDAFAKYPNKRIRFIIGFGTGGASIS